MAATPSDGVKPGAMPSTTSSAWARSANALARPRELGLGEGGPHARGPRRHTAERRRRRRRRRRWWADRKNETTLVTGASKARLDATLRKTTGGADLELDLRKEAARLREALDAPGLDDATRTTLKATPTDVVVRLSIVHEANGHRLLSNSALDFMPG